MIDSSQPGVWRNVRRTPSVGQNEFRGRTVPSNAPTLPMRRSGQVRGIPRNSPATVAADGGRDDRHHVAGDP